MHDSVTVHITAPPEPIWELVSDVTKIGRYSPETFEAEWIEGATHWVQHEEPERVNRLLIDSLR